MKDDFSPDMENPDIGGLGGLGGPPDDLDMENPDVGKTELTVATNFSILNLVCITTITRSIIIVNAVGFVHVTAHCSRLTLYG